jgi:creatinine amidohydrolase
MRFELMLPYQIKEAITKNIPIVLPIGVMEYHGEHMAVGMDTLAVTRSLDKLESQMEVVILPPFSYGAASYAVARPEGSGTLHVDAEVLAPLAEQIFTGLLRIGFRNIHGVVHHQTENFSAGMPTDLAFKIGARQAIFKFLEHIKGEAWWAAQDMRDYYAKHQSGSDPFNWIKLHPLMDAEIIKNYIFDHAGEGETSLLMALAPEGVEMDRVSENTTWYTQSAVNSSSNKGDAVTLQIVKRLLERLNS